MKKLILLLSFTMVFISTAKASTTDVINYDPFGNVTIYKPKASPKSFVLFISGDGGWNIGAVNMVKNMLHKNTMVVGVNIKNYYKNIKKDEEKCYYPAGDFEDLSIEIQKKYKFNSYLKPILVGYSSGATLAYGALAQAPANTFKGVIGLGFSPDLELDKYLCNGSGLTSKVLKPRNSFYLNPSNKLTAPFIVLQGIQDQVCTYAAAEKYMKEVNTEQLISLPNVGHGFSVTKNWLPEFKTAFEKIQNAPAYAEKQTIEGKSKEPVNFQPYKTSMPLTIIHSENKENAPLAFIISGDGGWTSFDQGLGEQFSKNGIPVIGLNAQSYFWKAKTPQNSAFEISKAIEHYMKQWNKKSFILVGYSFGASVAPFIANNFPADLKEKMKGVYSLSPEETADFEIHLSDMLNIGSARKYNVLSEIDKIEALNPICFFGNEESEKLRKRFESSGVKVITIVGNHHYNNGFIAIVDSVLKFYNLIK